MVPSNFVHCGWVKVNAVNVDVGKSCWRPADHEEVGRTGGHGSCKLASRKTKQNQDVIDGMKCKGLDRFVLEKAQTKQLPRKAAPANRQRLSLQFKQHKKLPTTEWGLPHRCSHIQPRLLSLTLEGSRRHPVKHPKAKAGWCRIELNRFGW